MLCRRLGRLNRNVLKNERTDFKMVELKSKCRRWPVLNIEDRTAPPTSALSSRAGHLRNGCCP